MPVFACPMTSVPVRATGSVISWIGKGVMMPTASRASAVSGRIPSSRNVVVRVLPLLCARCEASAGVVADHVGDVGRPWGETGKTRDLCRRSSVRTAEGIPPVVVRNVPYGQGGLSGRSRSGHRPGILIRAARRILGRRITTIPRIRAHAMADSVTLWLSHRRTWSFASSLSH
ncbi:hypothetical protein CP966_23990 [Streptomyces galilaeus]|nr:hypothetical protein CP966_23990 [Streptomyces galilaeus]